ncbi:MAG: cyclic nucleotide-binding domain-containing protein [Deltaproteobacteria bacterium]|jgi:CRP/FNR family transcriptional regulator, cyclic AMP receptor protein|nr:cyclic nucleotide-binding domain-containing protein [Deltaproteobacteria bacterium]MBT6492211.1 cyclic nucleotide-binding domain-containing protein [Deltaproteobacteria bacterium]
MASEVAKKAAFIRQLPLFHGFNDAEYLDMAEKMKVHRIEAGMFICKENAPGDTCFIIARGQVDILTGRGSQVHKLCSLGPGHAIGEIALIDGNPRSASARATENVIIFSLKRENFLALVNEGNHAGYKLLQNLVSVLSDRVRQVGDRYVDIFSKPGDTIAELNQRMGQLQDLQAMVAGSGDAKKDLLELVGYTGHLAPSSK